MPVLEYTYILTCCLKMESGIYAIKNTATGRYYIRSSKNLQKRWQEHRYHLKRGTHHSLKLQRSYDKHGVDAFEFSVLKRVDDLSSLEEVEAEFIELYKAWTDGYNVLKRGAKLADYPDGTVRNVNQGSYVHRQHKKPTKERLNLRVSGTRLDKIRRVAEQREKTMTHLVEDWIDRLQEENPS